jgi:hypothetical protein
MNQFVFMSTVGNFKNVFEIGITSNPEKRIGTHRPGSKYLILFECQDCAYLESILLCRFNSFFKPRNDITNHSFEGNIEVAKADFMEICFNIQELCIRYPLPNPLPVQYSQQGTAYRPPPPPPRQYFNPSASLRQFPHMRQPTRHVLTHTPSQIKPRRDWRLQSIPSKLALI